MNDRILVFGDPHVTLHNEFSKPTEDGLTTYLQEMTRTFEWLRGLMRSWRPGRVICLGDVFDQTGMVDTRSLVVGARGFLGLQEEARNLEGEGLTCELHILVGNHDLYDHHNRLHSLEWLQDYWFVHDRPDQEGWAVFLPWTQDAKQVQEIVESSRGVIFSHLEIEGSLRNTLGSPTEDKGIKLSTFHNRTVFNGHYHTPHTLDAGPSGVIVNVGSTNSRSFGDVDSPPRGAILLTSGGKMERRDNPHQRFYRDITIGGGFNTPDHARTVARVYYRAGEEEEAEGFKKQIEDARLIPVGSEKVVREESLAPVNTPVQNLQAYLELHLPDLADPAQYAALDAYATWLVGRVPIERFPQAIRFDWLKLQNFMSVEKAEIGYGKGIVLVEGENQDDPTAASNGSGKTVITVEGLYWLLTGTTLRKLPVEEVVQEGKTECLVSGGMQIGPDRYIITRTRTNTGKGAGGALQIEKNGVAIEVRKGKDTEGKLQDVLRLSPTRLFQTILLTADLQSRFSQLGPSDRLRVVEEMAGVTLYDDLRAICKQDVDAKDRAFRELRLRVDGTNHTITNASAEVEALQVEVQTAEAETAKVIGRLDEEAAKLTEQGVILHAELINAQKALEVEKGEGTGVLDAKLTEAHKQVRERQAAAQNLSAQVISLQREGAQIRGRRGTVCPTCGQRISEDFSCADRLKQIGEELLRLERDASTAQAALAVATQAHDRLQEFRAQYQGRVRERHAQVSSLTDQRENSRRAVVQNRATREMAVGQTDRLRGALDRQRGALERIKVQVEQLTRERDQAEIDLGVSQWWLAALGTAGIRAFINEQSLATLNEHLKDYSPRILGPGLGTIYLSSYRETQAGGVSNKIDIRLSGGRSFAKLSSGQRRRVDLAVQFSLNDLAGSTSGSGSNLLICDEILDPIDELGCRGVVEILREKATKLQVYLTTHNAALKALQFDGRLTVRLQGGTSVLLGGGA